MDYIEAREAIVLYESYLEKRPIWKELYETFNYRPRYQYWDLMLDMGLVTDHEYDLAGKYYEWEDLNA